MAGRRFFQKGHASFSNPTLVSGVSPKRFALGVGALALAGVAAFAFSTRSQRAELKTPSLNNITLASLRPPALAAPELRVADEVVPPTGKLGSGLVSRPHPAAAGPG